MMHVVDADDELMWTDDHNPPTPTTQWKPGQTVEYTRTVFVPVYPYVGEATLQMGLYSTTTQTAPDARGEDAGQRAYKVAQDSAAAADARTCSRCSRTAGIRPRSPSTTRRSSGSGRRSRRRSRSRIPKKDCTFYLDVDQPGGIFNENQHVTVTSTGRGRRQFDVTPKNQQLRQDPAEGGPAWQRRDGRTADPGGQDVRARCKSPAAPARIRASSASACSMPSSSRSAKRRFLATHPHRGARHWPVGRRFFCTPIGSSTPTRPSKA